MDIKQGVQATKEKFKTTKGIMLVELLFSLGVLVVVMLVAFYVLLAAHHLSEESRQRLLALNTANTVLEIVKETPLQGVGGIVPNNFLSADLPNGNVAIVTNPINLNGAQIATITVNVTWVGPRGRALNLQISTMKSVF